tara:strand:+ start:204 stop:431 length:228 start_codon:yes stop_codon:yes gene_type:complete
MLCKVNHSCAIILGNSLLSFDMSKKSEQITFRTTPENIEYLKVLQDSDDRTQGWILNKMIQVFMDRGVDDASDLK